MFLWSQLPQTNRSIIMTCFSTKTATQPNEFDSCPRKVWMDCVCKVACKIFYQIRWHSMWIFRFLCGCGFDSFVHLPPTRTLQQMDSLPRTVKSVPVLDCDYLVRVDCWAKHDTANSATNTSFNGNYRKFWEWWIGVGPKYMVLAHKSQAI